MTTNTTIKKQTINNMNIIIERTKDNENNDFIFERNKNIQYIKEYYEFNKLNILEMIG
jgi:hypothetical protein